MKRIVVFLLVGLIVGGTAPGQSDAKKKVHAALDQWLDRRSWGEDAGSETNLIVKIKNASLTEKDIVDMLRAGRASYPAPLATPGKLSEKLELVCDHVDYTTTFLLYIPSNYDPKTAWPLLIVGHGGNAEMSQARAEATAADYIQSWLPAAEEKGFIVAAPATARGWSWIGNSIIFSLISKLTRALHIDEERIFPTGHSMGGHMSWRSGIFYPDRFGAIGPMSGGYDFVENRQIINLWNIPGYATHGAEEPYQIADFNRKMKGYMDAHGYDFQIVEKPGGHEIFDDEIPKQLDFFRAHPRSLDRPTIAFSFGGLTRIETCEPKKDGWPIEHTWKKGRPITSDTYGWVRLFDPEPGSAAAKEGQFGWIVRTSKSSITMTTKNVKKLRLFLSKRVLDLAKPIELTINGEKRSVRAKESGLSPMLRHVREFDDRTRIFDGWVDVEISTSKDVPEPKAP